ncbi:MAG: hypothetical protein ACI4FX_05240 [Agathobacter sp.]
MDKVKTTVKSILFLFLALFICTMNAASVSAETTKTETTQEISEIQSQTYDYPEPKLYLDEDYDGPVNGNKLEVSGYVSNFRRAGIEKVYFNDTEVSLKENGSFTKTIHVALNTKKKYRICIKAENGDIISSETIKVYRQPTIFMSSIIFFIIGVLFIILGIHGIYRYDDGTSMIVVGALVIIFSIVSIVLFCAGII